MPRISRTLLSCKSKPSDCELLGMTTSTHLDNETYWVNSDQKNLFYYSELQRSSWTFKMSPMKPDSWAFQRCSLSSQEVSFNVLLGEREKKSTIIFADSKASTLVVPQPAGTNWVASALVCSTCTKHWNSQAFSRSCSMLASKQTPCTVPPISEFLPLLQASRYVFALKARKSSTRSQRWQCKHKLDSKETMFEVMRNKLGLFSPGCSAGTTKFFLYRFLCYVGRCSFIAGWSCGRFLHKLNEIKTCQCNMCN